MGIIRLRAAQTLLPNADVVPVSGKTGDNVERLLES